MEISGAQLCADLKQVRKKYFTNEVRTPLNLFIYLFIFSMDWRIQISGEPFAATNNSSKLLFSPSQTCLTRITVN